MGGMTEAQAEHIAQRARAEGEYGEITIHHREGYGYWVTGRKVVNGQGIGRTWGYDDILLERATCGHPPSRYYGYAAADGTIVMGCCNCGAVLTGAAEDETPDAGGVPAGRDDRRDDMATTTTLRQLRDENEAIRERYDAALKAAEAETARELGTRPGGLIPFLAPAHLREQAERDDAARRDYDRRADEIEERHGVPALLAAMRASSQAWQDAIDAADPPTTPRTNDEAETCWECGTPIEPGHGIIDALGWAHRSCVGA
jgi:hypothetical protein